MKKYRIMSIDGVVAEIQVPQHAPQAVHDAAIQELQNWQKNRLYTKERKEMMEKYDLFMKIFIPH